MAGSIAIDPAPPPAYPPDVGGGVSAGGDAAAFLETLAAVRSDGGAKPATAPRRDRDTAGGTIVHDHAAPASPDEPARPGRHEASTQGRSRVRSTGGSSDDSRDAPVRDDARPGDTATTAAAAAVTSATSAPAPRQDASGQGAGAASPPAADSTAAVTGIAALSAMASTAGMTAASGDAATSALAAAQAAALAARTTTGDAGAASDIPTGSVVAATPASDVAPADGGTTSTAPATAATAGPAVPAPAGDPDPAAGQPLPVSGPDGRQAGRGGATARRPEAVPAGANGARPDAAAPVTDDVGPRDAEPATSAPSEPVAAPATPGTVPAPPARDDGHDRAAGRVTHEARAATAVGSPAAPAEPASPAADGPAAGSPSPAAGSGAATPAPADAGDRRHAAVAIHAAPATPATSVSRAGETESTSVEAVQPAGRTAEGRGGSGDAGAGAGTTGGNGTATPQSGTVVPGAQATAVAATTDVAAPRVHQAGVPEAAIRAADGMLTRIVERLHNLGGTVIPGLEARLHDPELGDVRLSVAGRAGDVVRAEIVARDETAAAALSRSVDRYQQSGGDLSGIQLQVRAESGGQSAARQWADAGGTDGRGDQGSSNGRPAPAVVSERVGRLAMAGPRRGIDIRA